MERPEHTACRQRTQEEEDAVEDAEVRAWWRQGGDTKCITESKETS